MPALQRRGLSTLGACASGTSSRGVCAVTTCWASIESCTPSGRSLTQGKRGYALHPETLRWQGRLRALYGRHHALVREMGARGYNHGTPLDESLATGLEVQDRYVDLPDVQIELLRAKGCSCTLDAVDQDAIGGGDRPSG